MLIHICIYSQYFYYDAKDELLIKKFELEKKKWNFVILNAEYNVIIHAF